MSAAGAAPAEGEVMREGRRVLRKLAAEGASLAPAGDSHYAVSVSGCVRRTCARVAVPIVQAFRRRDWIAPDEDRTDCFRLTEAGLGWVRRAQADGDPFAAQHRLTARREVMSEGGTVKTVLVNEGESPLGWLHRRRGADGKPLISRAQWEAGERLRADFHLAHLAPRMAVDLAAPVVAGRRGAKDAPLAETVLAAKQRFSSALKAAGPGLADLLVDVCCHLTGLEDAEKRKGWPQRSAKVVLQLALDRLALHYGLGPVRGTGRHTRTWHAPVEDDHVQA